MASPRVLSDGLTVQSLATIIFFAVSLAIQEPPQRANVSYQTCRYLSTQQHDVCIFYISILFPNSQAHEWQPSPMSGMLITGKLRGQVFYFTSEFDAPSRFSGRYPWAIEDALRKYGDVLRIAPNELCFFTPQAFLGKYLILTLQQFTDTPSDIYSPHQKNLEVFVKTNFQNRGKDLGGIVWEEDPVRHRVVAKKLSPAFSN